MSSVTPVTSANPPPAKALSTTIIPASISTIISLVALWRSRADIAKASRKKDSEALLELCQRFMQFVIDGEVSSGSLAGHIRKESLLADLQSFVLRFTKRKDAASLVAKLELRLSDILDETDEIKTRELATEVAKIRGDLNQII
jgi:hypothetical protein